MPGNPVANYKTIQRFLAQVDIKTQLIRLFQEDVEFVIRDPTDPIFCLNLSPLLIDARC